MTDLPDAAADKAADASTPDIDMAAGDPERAAVPDAPVALTDGKRPRSPRRRRSLALRFGVSFVLGFLLAVRRRRRRPVRMGPAVRRPGPARRPRRQHGTRRAHPRAGGGEGREGLWVAGHRADHAHRPGRPTIDHQLRRPRPRPRHLGAARRGIRGRPPERAPREPHQRTPGRAPRRDPRLRRCLRPRQAGGGR